MYRILVTVFGRRRCLCVVFPYLPLPPYLMPFLCMAGIFLLVMEAQSFPSDLLSVLFDIGPFYSLLLPNDNCKRYISVAWLSLKRSSCTYAFTSSVASLPTICIIALSPPGWYLNQASTFITCWSIMMIDLPSEMSPSICLRERTGRIRFHIFVEGMASQLGTNRCQWAVGGMSRININILVL